MEFKNKKDRDLFFLLAPSLIMIYADLYQYAKTNYDIELVITSTISTKLEDERLGRTSNSHFEKRAIDIRTRDIDPFIVGELVEYINNKKEYEIYHYESNNGINRLAYYHVGTEEHIHLSVHSKFKPISSRITKI